MEATPDLENYLASARITHSVELRRGGGGHQSKQLVVLDGGLGAVAKLAEPDEEAPRRMVRAEVAAWLLADELGWRDLVPTTVLRTVRSLASGDEVEASVQVVWPFFETAMERTATPQNCPDDSAWRIAIFDALARNPDRNESNWGFIQAHDEPKLIDHGHAFEAHAGGPSPFVERWRDEAIPREHLDRLDRFTGSSHQSRLREVLDGEVVDRLVERGRSFVQGGTLSV